jgi:hypothetical protein
MQAFHLAKQSSVFAATQLVSRRVPVAKERGRRLESHRKAVSSQHETYRAGDVVRQSGIYEAIHEGAHRGPHDVVMIESDLFPPCDTCSDQVRFRLVRSAPYIFTDEDFEKPR